MGILQYFLDVEKTLDRCLSKGDLFMAKLHDFKTLLIDVEAETTRLGTRIDELLAKLEAGGMTEEEEAEVFDGFKAVSTRMKGIGVNPDQPIPPAV